jgi:hypothetical protein
MSGQLTNEKRLFECNVPTGVLEKEDTVPIQFKVNLDHIYPT